jgi:hypothetical protein
MEINAGGIHLSYPLLAKVAELFQKRGGCTAKSQSAIFELSPRPLEKPGMCEMFFKSDGSHESVGPKRL